MSHYDTLQVAPWAEDAVVRAAYRALMRLYHPDTNHDPGSDVRVREITRAFAVLGDPAKRAAYDALPTLGNEMQSEQRHPFAAAGRWRPKVRDIGVASVTMALALGLAAAVWWNSASPRMPQELRTAGANPRPTHVAAAISSDATRKKPSRPVNDSGPVSRMADTAAAPLRSTQEASPVTPNDHTLSVPRREITQMALSGIPAPKPLRSREITQIAEKAPASEAIPNSASESRDAAACGEDLSNVGNGECTVDQQAQIERLATGFLNQSLEHADFHKQELLLSARNRSTFSRTLCHSKNCVTQTYMREISETTEIMQGLVPTP